MCHRKIIILTGRNPRRNPRDCLNWHIIRHKIAKVEAQLSSIPISQLNTHPTNKVLTYNAKYIRAIGLTCTGACYGLGGGIYKTQQKDLKGYLDDSRSWAVMRVMIRDPVAKYVASRGLTHRQLTHKASFFSDDAREICG